MNRSIAVLSLLDFFKQFSLTPTGLFASLGPKVKYLDASTNELIKLGKKSP
jgi:hypothetical protein